MPDADIRKPEIDSIVSFLLSSSKKVLIVEGTSGMGKSYCVDSAIRRERLAEDRILSYIFYPKFNLEDDDFPLFLYHQYQKRKLIGVICNLVNKIGFSFDSVDLQAETPRLHFPFISPPYTELSDLCTGGMRVNLRFKPAWYNSNNNREEVVKNYLSCFKDKIDYIRIINYGKASTKALSDKLIVELVKQVCSMSECNLKIIIETPDIYEESSISSDLDAALKNTIQHIKLLPLNDEDTIKLFKHYHPDCEIPDKLIKETSGRPYYIQYYNNQDDAIPNGDNTKVMFSSLSEEAEIIMYALAALGWKASREQLRNISSLQQDLEKCLMELNRKKLVSFDEDEVRINEPISFKFLFSNDYRPRLLFFGHHKVIHFLSNKKTRTHEEHIEFMRQYQKISKVSLASQYAFQYAYQCYTNQDYQFFEDCLPFIESHGQNDDILVKAQILSLQVSICLGDVNKAEHYIQQRMKQNSLSIENRVENAVKKISLADNKKRQQHRLHDAYDQYIAEEEDASTSEILLYTQYLYLKNKFEEAIRILNNIIHSVDVWYQGRIEGILTACYSALGKRQEMKEAYKKACQNARENNDLELQYELKRLIPQVEDQEVRDEQFAQFLKEKHPAEYSYLASKIYHNFAVDRIFEVNDKDAYKYLFASACFFEQGKYVEYSYSCICLSAVFIVNNSLKNAKAILESCEVFLHEQYDKICWNINMSIISFLNGENGYQYLNTAYIIEKDQKNGLNDPYFTFLRIYNKLCFDILSNKKVSLQAIRELHIPVGCFQNSKKEQRRAMILERCEDYVRKDDFIEISEALGIPLFEVATLQFFDFNSNVLKKDFISDSAVDDSLH